MNPKISTRALTEGALMSGITALLGVLSYYIPFLTLLIFAWPIPIVLLGKRHGLAVSGVATLVSGVLLSLFTPILFAIQIVVMYGLLALALAFAYQKELGTTRTFLVGYATSLISIVVLMQLYSLFTGVSIVTELTEMMRISMEEVQRMYAGMGMDLTTLEQSLGQVDHMIQTMSRLFPATILIIPATITFINMFASEKLLSRLGYRITGIPPFRTWKLPNHASFGFLGILLLAMFGLGLNIPNFDLVYQNLLYIILMVFFIQGLAVISYVSYQRGLSKAFTVIFIIMLLMMPFLQSIVQLVGLLESVFHLRDKIKFGGKS